MKEVYEIVLKGPDAIHQHEEIIKKTLDEFISRGELTSDQFIAFALAGLVRFVSPKAIYYPLDEVKINKVKQLCDSLSCQSVETIHMICDAFKKRCEDHVLIPLLESNLVFEMGRIDKAWEILSGLSTKHIFIEFARLNLLVLDATANPSKRHCVPEDIILQLESMRLKGMLIAEQLIGYCYEKGIRTEVDKFKAALFLQKSSLSGDFEAQTFLNSLWEEFKELSRSEKEPLSVIEANYQSAADAGSSIAQYGLAKFYELVHQDEKRAYQCYDITLNQMDDKSCVLIAREPFKNLAMTLFIRFLPFLYDANAEIVPGAWTFLANFSSSKELTTDVDFLPIWVVLQALIRLRSKTFQIFLNDSPDDIVQPHQIMATLEVCFRTFIREPEAQYRAFSDKFLAHFPGIATHLKNKAVKAWLNYIKGFLYAYHDVTVKSIEFLEKAAKDGSVIAKCDLALLYFKKVFDPRLALNSRVDFRRKRHQAGYQELQKISGEFLSLSKSLLKEIYSLDNQVDLASMSHHLFSADLAFEVRLNKCFEIIDRRADQEIMTFLMYCHRIRTILNTTIPSFLLGKYHESRDPLLAFEFYSALLTKDFSVSAMGVHYLSLGRQFKAKIDADPSCSTDLYAPLQASFLRAAEGKQVEAQRFLAECYEKGTYHFIVSFKKALELIKSLLNEAPCDTELQEKQQRLEALIRPQTAPKVKKKTQQPPLAPHLVALELDDEPVEAEEVPKPETLPPSNPPSEEIHLDFTIKEVITEIPTRAPAVDQVVPKPAPLSEEQRQIKRLEEELLKIKKEDSALRHRLHNLVESHRKERCALESGIQDLRTERDELRLKNIQSNDHIAHLEERLCQKSDSRDKKEEPETSFLRELRATRVELDKLKHEALTHQQKLSAREHEIGLLQHEIRTLRQANSGLGQRLTFFQHESHALRHNIHYLSHEVMRSWAAYQEMNYTHASISAIPAFAFDLRLSDDYQQILHYGAPLAEDKAHIYFAYWNKYQFLPGAKYYLGVCYATGTGVKVDKERALCYCKLAESEGFTEAKDFIANLKSERIEHHTAHDGERAKRRNSF